MKDVLQNLANIQYLDRQIDELEQLRGNLPEEILDIQTDINRQQARMDRLKEQGESLEQEAIDLEVEAKDAEAKLVKYEDQQTSVRNNREYDALTREIESQQQLIKNAKSRREEIAKRREEIEPELQEAHQLLDQKEGLKTEKEEQLSEVEENTESGKRKLVEKREEIEKSMNPRYLRSYKRLHKGLKNGLAVVPMEKGAAIGMALPPQTQVEVRRMNKIIIDENSGRIVVDPFFFEKAKEDLS